MGETYRFVGKYFCYMVERVKSTFFSLVCICNISLFKLISASCILAYYFS